MKSLSTPFLGPTAWQANFFARHDIFLPLVEPARAFSAAPDWPDLAAYNDLAERFCIKNIGAKPIRFIHAGPKRRRKRRHATSAAKAENAVCYEGRVFETGEVLTRPRHWHDFLNMLIWCRYPRLKAALNARQMGVRHEAIDPAIRAGRRRNAEQDRLTMFDEGGIVLVCPAVQQPELLARLAAVQVSRSESVISPLVAGTQVFLIGHAILEAIQADEWQRTAMTYVMAATSDFFAADLTTRCQLLDKQLAKVILEERILAKALSFPGFPIATLR